MAVISNGIITKSTTYTTFTPASWNGIPQPGITLRQWGYPGAFELGSYAAIYKRHVWVAALVNKIARAEARLPLKVYLRDDLNRPEAPDDPYATLLRRPSSILSPFDFWQWVRSTREIYGEAPLLKVRDRGGRPVELVPFHPSRLYSDDDKWEVDIKGQRTTVQRHDLVLFRSYNPDSPHRGLSPLEPLRATLENEEGARRANSAMWRNGGRPSMTLQHPTKIGPDGVKRLRSQWEEVHGGVDNWAKTVILEEGMQAVPIPLNIEELQYVEARKLNREEACAVYDVPPPVVHILDRATFSNITEQMRSMYRDTMAPKLKSTESTLEHELRDGRMGRNVEPDFSDTVYAEFLLDEVLRGDFEARSAAYSAADYMTIAEKRKAENLPFIEGTDRIYVNAAIVPLDEADEPMSVSELALTLQKIYLAVGSVITPEEAREILNRGGAGLGSAPTVELVPTQRLSRSVDPAEMRSVMGRLGRAKSFTELDIPSLLAGLSPQTIAALAEAAEGAEDVPDLRRRLRTLTP